MNVFCVHCEENFSITADQLGTRGKCPHCRATIRLPRADSVGGPDYQELKAPSAWMENSLSFMLTVILHLVALIVLALIPWGHFAQDREGDGEAIVIGQLARENLVESDEQLDVQALQKPSESFDSLEQQDIVPPSTTADDSDLQFDLTLTTPSGGTDQSMNFDGFRAASSDETSVQDFGKLISRLKRDGLDIVITFDSTSSMSDEIRQVKDKIERIGGALFQLVPKTRISICTYRDEDDAYVARGLRLTDDLSKIIDYLDGIRAEGGNDIPEAVDQGLKWAITRNKFRPRARKIVLVFGDAPPHQRKKATCLRIAADFRRQQNGIVSTVTCRAEKRMEEFIEIAQMGGGEAFLTRDEREIMTQLMILVFGSKHREKVVEALNLLGG